MIRNILAAATLAAALAACTGNQVTEPLPEMAPSLNEGGTLPPVPADTTKDGRGVIGSGT